EDFGDVTVVRLRLPKAIDDETIRTAFAPIYSLLDVGCRKLVLNLADVHYLPSMGLGKLVMLNRRMQAAAGRLALTRLSPTVTEVLEGTHILHLFSAHGTEQEAVQSLGEVAKV